jgi:hypothetical protein
VVRGPAVSKCAAVGQRGEDALAASGMNHRCLRIRPRTLGVVATASPRQNNHECLEHELAPDSLQGGVRPLRGTFRGRVLGESGQIPHLRGRARQAKTKDRGEEFAFVGRVGRRPEPEGCPPRADEGPQTTR